MRSPEDLSEAHPIEEIRRFAIKRTLTHLQRLEMAAGDPASAEVWMAYLRMSWQIQIRALQRARNQPRPPWTNYEKRPNALPFSD